MHNDQGDKEGNAHIVFTPTVTDDYRVVATSSEKGETGYYMLQIVRPVPRTMAFYGELEKNDPKCEHRTGSHADMFTIKMEAGKSYEINLTSPTFDTYLFLRDRTGKLLVRDDDGGEGLNSRITYTPTVTGEYQVMVSSYRSSATGYYTMTVIRSN